MLQNYVQGFIIPRAIMVNWNDGSDETVDVVVTSDGDLAKMVPVGSVTGHVSPIQVVLDEKDLIALVEFMVTKFNSHNLLELSATVSEEVARRRGERETTAVGKVATNLEDAIRAAYPGYLERVWDQPQEEALEEAS